MKKVEKSIELGGRTLTLKTGILAEQASGAILASYGDTVVLATVVAAPMMQDLGYFPLMVEYQERLYAGGRIKGSRWVKREGRPSDDEIQSARLIDRSIRPLFPKSYKKDVQVMITVLSVDFENDPSILSAIAASAAIAISPIPWKGPVGTVRVGLKDGAYFTNPIDSELTYSDLDLVVSSTSDAVAMIEAGARQVSEEVVLNGIAHAQKEIHLIIKLIKELTNEVGAEKESVPETPHEISLENQVKKLAGERIKDLIKKTSVKKAGQREYDDIKLAVVSSFEKDEAVHAAAAFEDLFREIGREVILKGERPDGRKTDEIREVSAAVGVLPRTHGSAIFQRGQTQVLTVTTLGAPSLEQLIESAGGEESKRYIHHYSMPPYSLGETGRIGFPSRREIGHGALAERALFPIIPTEDKFPYTIRVVSEVTSSNGSTSMASVCGSTLSLMDAGVPLSSPVTGIAMGLVVENNKKFVVLSDITGFEDGIGDMDFKVAGTQEGITALQLDVKTLNLTTEILGKALSQAKEGRTKILEAMLATLKEPRAKVSVYAPKIKVLRVPLEKIGEVIGPGGRIIRKIIAETGTEVEVEDDGSVNISGMTEEAVENAAARIEALTREVTPGEIYEGVVKRVQPFGAFVEILPGKEGLVHVSDMSMDFVRDPSQVVSVGDKVQVRVKEIDELGRINLSMILTKDMERPRRDVGFRHPRMGFGRRGRGDQRAMGHYERRERGGPHFPATRLLDQDKKGFAR